MLGFLEGLMSSWVIYPVLAAVSLIDAILPVIPSEAPLIMSGVFAANSGRPALVLVILCAAAGAAAGDHVTYFIGRYLARRWLLDAAVGSRRQRMMHTARSMLDERGGSTLIVARFIPGGRIALNLLMGATRYPLRKYTPLDLLATLIWATYGAVVGYLGGSAFEKNPIAGLLLGLGIAVMVTAVSEGLRVRKRRRRNAASTPVDVGEADLAQLADRPAGAGAGIR